MKTNRIILTAVSLLLICAIAVNMTGCTMKVQAKDLMAGIRPNEVTTTDDLSVQSKDITDFAVRLFRASAERDVNSLISPLSVLYALAMTANGADGKTLEEMEAVLGLTAEALNHYLYNYMEHLPQGEKYKLSLANSIWFTEDDRFTVNQDFLQTNADYFGADLYQAPFNDDTCKDINNWVKENTDGMIPAILDQLPPDGVMCLVNALAFDGEWSATYEKHQVQEGTFTKEDGTKQKADFMYGEDRIYLEDEKATGFMKSYKGGKYAFVALLPKEGVSIAEYMDSLEGEALHALLSDPSYRTVRTAIPKFETEYDVEMSEILKTMGMPSAFDISVADFTGLGTSTAGNIYISQVLHKTFISVGEKGTKAGAATAIIAAGGAMIEIEEPKEVYLDRPFVYMLIDCEYNIPFFIGTMMMAEKAE